LQGGLAILIRGVSHTKGVLLVVHEEFGGRLLRINGHTLRKCHNKWCLNYNCSNCYESLTEALADLLNCGEDCVVIITGFDVVKCVLNNTWVCTSLKDGRRVPVDYEVIG